MDSHAQLFGLRNQYPRNDYMQGILGPMEHSAFAEQWVRDNPYIAIPSLLFAIPAYTAAKKAGLTNARSPANIDEIFGGYEGMIRGLLNQEGF